MSSKRGGIIYKTASEIDLIRKSGDLLGRAIAEVGKNIKPGVTTLSLDKIAYDYITAEGGHPSFLGYKVGRLSFPHSLCISVNDAVVHGMPGAYVLKEGDLISIDGGVYLNGYHADSAYTFPVGEVKAEYRKLLRDTLDSLFEGIKACRQGNRTGDIGYAVQRYCEQKGYGVVRELVGHGIGRDLHEAPEVPNFGKRNNGSLLQNGLVVAIEPMINLGTENVYTDRDGWTIRTADHKPSAHYEHTVGIINGVAEPLTTFRYIDEIITI